MLQLQNIFKTYVTGEFTQNALEDVSISFRENEFVSILGPSGSGKTTLLNIIGGLDRYDSGDLIINGVSTRQYKDADWDLYRNSSIGFVFQSYNLIPHQSILSNVELALTLAGVSKKERRERAAAVLKKVGLGDHMHKKPNQMSGGQMQRVAIARALVNDPDILLADEPTGALDSETSIQIMELLKEIARDKLVVLVTHNPDLAEKYSTRTVRLLDGKIVGDTDPFAAENAQAAPGKKKKVSMSFATALSLSFNNLRTKKGRTILTAFAGSIGIIGIALILALSTGMNQYIDHVQRDTMASYPLTISAETVDIAGIQGSRMAMMGERMGVTPQERTEDRAGVYADCSDIEDSRMMASSVVENDLTRFKKYLDDPDSEIWRYLGENGVVYAYDVAFSVYTHDPDGALLNTDADVDGLTDGKSAGGGLGGRLGLPTAVAAGPSSGAENFSELMVGANGAAVSQVVTDSYDVLYGDWPREADEVILVLDGNNGVPAGTLYQLGLISGERYKALAEQAENGEAIEEISFDYEEVCAHSFYLVPACFHYVENEDGTFTPMENEVLDEETLLERALELRIVGVVRPGENADNAEISTAVAYTSKLTDYVIEQTDGSAIVRAQEADPAVNVLNGMAFEALNDEEKIADAKEYIDAMGISEKASLYKMVLYYQSQNTEGSETEMTQSQIPGQEQAAAQVQAAGQADGVSAMNMDETAMAAALDQWSQNDPDEDILLAIYDEYIGAASYEDNMKDFGKVSYDAPSSISIYADTFEAKDSIAACIENYNEAADEDARISYTDYVALLTSSITTIINGISYVLIAFVAISLVVSCMMIGIITNISVMERTKEIGILRALGASKRNISQVFNAETFIIGCCAGALGVGVSLLLLLPINSLIEGLSGIAGLTAQLPVTSSLILIAISIVITLIGGLFPAKKAAKMDPVVALRTE